jgi:RNA polymerase sigma-70 factor (ECF subfamily)
MLSADAAAGPQAGFDDEAAFVLKLAAYDSAAWRNLFDLYFDRIFGFAFVRTNDADAANDIAADVFSEAAKGIGRYRYRGVPIRAWLYKIARNLIADHVKARIRRPVVPLDLALDVVAPNPPDIEMRADFYAALSGLTLDQREVLVLRFVNDCSLAEVAEATGRSVNAVKQLQHRAVLALRERLLVDDGAAKS